MISAWIINYMNLYIRWVWLLIHALKFIRSKLISFVKGLPRITFLSYSVCRYKKTTSYFQNKWQEITPLFTTSGHGYVFLSAGPFEGIPWVTGDFTAQRSVMRSFNVIFAQKCVQDNNKQSSGVCLEIPWWRHQMETFFVLLALCAVTGEFSAQRPVTQSFDGFCFLRWNNWWSKQSWGW